MYGLKLKPLPETNLPPGKIDFIPLKKARTMTIEDEREYTYGIVVYDRPLTHIELERHGLTDLNNASETTIWNAFVTFVREIRHVSPTYRIENFIADYLRSDGQRVAENPLYKYVQPNSPLIYSYLRKFTKYKPDYEGLKEFWASLEKR